MFDITPTTARRIGAVAVAGLALAGLSACSSSSTTSEASPSAAAGCPVSVSDPWVKAADKGMTAAFGTLQNSGASAVDIVSASTPDSASMELHEVVDNNGQMVMQPVAGGITVPANGDLKLEPGGYHLMLMDVTTPIKAGQDVPITLSCADGSTVDFTAQAREFEGGDEQYQKDGMDSMEGGDMDGGSMTPSPATS